MSNTKDSYVCMYVLLTLFTILAVDMSFQKAVMVYEIYDDGAIAKDDRLLCGDQILEVGLRALCHMACL